MAGQTYQIAVDGFDGAAGRVELHVGTTAPRLSSPRMQPNGSFQFALVGTAGSTNEIQSTTNFLNWVKVATVVNTNGVVNFADPATTGSPRRFYRALLK
jgi:hypothetical protein